MSGLGAQGGRSLREEGVATWPSYDSLFNVPAGTSGSLSKTSSGADTCTSSPALGPTRQLRRKKALTQLRLASRSSMGSLMGPSSTLLPFARPKDDDSHDTGDHSNQVTSDSDVKANTFNLPTLLTLSGEQMTRINEKHTYKFLLQGS